MRALRRLAALAAALLAWPALAAGTGHIFVSRGRGSEVVVLSPDLEILHRIETSRRPRDMHFNEDRTMPYVACGDDDVIDVIELATMEVVDSIAAGPSPEVFALSPDRTRIHVSNEEDSTLDSLGTDEAEFRCA